MHFYDEQRLLLGQTYRAGDKVRLTASAGAAWTVIDLLDSRAGRRPARQPDRGQRAALRRRPDRPPRLGRRVRQGDRLRQEGPPQGVRPAGHLPGQPAHHRRRRDDRGRRQLVHDHQGSSRSRSTTPAPDGSVHTGVGFYGKDADGGSRNVHLSGLHDRGRRPRAHRHRPGQRRRRRAQRLHHRRPLHPAHQGRHVVRRPDDQPRRSPTTSSSTRSPTPSTSTPASPIRWSATTSSATPATTAWPCGRRRPPNAGNTFDHNTVQTPMLANGIAIYGGTDNTVSNNLIADPIREGSGIHVGSRFGAEPFAGTLTITNNTDGTGGHARAELEHRPRRDLVLRPGQEHRRRHPGHRRPLPGQHLQRDHAGLRLAA